MPTGVPLLVIIETDGEDLLLSLLHTSSDDLHSLIQQERLRWLVFCIAVSTFFSIYYARTGLVLITHRKFSSVLNEFEA